MKSIAETIIAVRRVILPLLIALLAVGCASISQTNNSGSVDQAESVHDMSDGERVFRYQAQVANTLLDHYPLVEVLETADPSLIEAEARMTEFCSPLTQAVLSHQQGEKPSLGLRLRVMSTIDECERAAQEVDALMNATAVADSI